MPISYCEHIKVNESIKLFPKTLLLSCRPNDGTFSIAEVKESRYDLTYRVRGNALASGKLKPYADGRAIYPMGNTGSIAPARPASSNDRNESESEV